MDPSVLQTMGKIAGVGGLALGVFLFLFREVIRKRIFPQLDNHHAYSLIRLFMILTFAIATIGIGAWVLVEIKAADSRNIKAGTDTTPSPVVPSVEKAAVTDDNPNPVAPSVEKAAVHKAASVTASGVTQTRAWEQTWLAVQDRHDFYYGHDPYGNVFANRPEHLRLLNRVELHGDPKLNALKQKIVREVQQAETIDDDFRARDRLADRYDMRWTKQLTDDFNEFEFQVRAEAVEHGVKIERSEKRQ